MFERIKYHVTYFEVINKSIMLQCFADKQKYHVLNENSCVGSKEKPEYHVWHFTPVKVSTSH